MNNDHKLKEHVKKQYGQIAQQQESCCCVSSGYGNSSTLGIMAESYTGLEGYNAEADLGLGCGLPTQFAQIKEGDTVIDLGSGAGNDCFVARAQTGATGRVIGIDFAPEMLEKARANARKMGYSNVEFRQGDLEHLPVEEAVADVVVSNCVLNLIPNKQAVFAEIYRVLKAGGHFSISDIVITSELPLKLARAANLYVECIAGAAQKKDYLNIIKEAGFHSVTVQKEKTIAIPGELLPQFLTAEEIMSYKRNLNVIQSITVYAEK